MLNLIKNDDPVREYQEIIESFGGKMPIVQCEREAPRVRKHPWPAKHVPQLSSLDKRTYYFDRHDSIRRIADPVNTWVL